MVEDRVTDSTRIAQLLASELTGLETGPFAHVEVIEANPDASPAPGGTEAYAITYRETRVGSVVLFPDHVELRLVGDAGTDSRQDDDRPSEVGVGLQDNDEAPVDAGLAIRETDEGPAVRIENGVAVKRAVDVLRTLFVDSNEDAA